MRKLGAKRKVALSNLATDPLVVSLFYPGPQKPCCLSSDTITTYTLTGLADARARYNQTGKTLLNFELSAIGLVTLVKAEASIEFEETVTVEKRVPDPDAPTPGAPLYAVDIVASVPSLRGRALHGLPEPAVQQHVTHACRSRACSCTGRCGRCW